MYQKLLTTPIKEIIFTISYKEDIESSILDKFCNDEYFKESFSRHEGFQANIKAISNSPVTTNVTKDGFVLRSDKLNYMVQVRKGSLAFHKIKDYEEFERLFERLEYFWTQLIALSGELTITKLSLRYLNFISMEGGETVDELIRIKVEHPFNFNLKNQFVQLNFTSDANTDLKINVVTAKGIDDKNQSGLVLDTILNLDIKDNNLLTDSFKLMRQVKNDIFFSTITQYTIDKYNGN